MRGDVARKWRRDVIEERVGKVLEKISFLGNSRQDMDRDLAGI